MLKTQICWWKKSCTRPGFTYSLSHQLLQMHTLEHTHRLRLFPFPDPFLLFFIRTHTHTHTHTHIARICVVSTYSYVRPRTKQVLLRDCVFQAISGHRWTWTVKATHRRSQDDPAIREPRCFSSGRNKSVWVCVCVCVCVCVGILVYMVAFVFQALHVDISSKCKCKAAK